MTGQVEGHGAPGSVGPGWAWVRSRALRLALSAWTIAAGVVCLELAVGTRYGPFRDELYYRVCAEHLSWGYVDHPPLSIAVLAGVRALFGDSLLALHLVPALVGGANVLVVARIARTLGGGGFA